VVSGRPGDEDWVSETLARAVLDDDPTRPREPAGTGGPDGAGGAWEQAAGPAVDRRPAGEADPGEASGDAGRPADESGTGPAPGEITGDAEGPGTDGERRGGSVVRSVLEWVAVIVGALALALVLRAVLFQAFFIPSESMEPTLRRDDRVLVNKLSYRLHEVNRGDVVVFARPPGEPPGGIDDLIKRVIALESETIEARDGQIRIDGMLLVETYLHDGAAVADFGPVTVPAGHVFVMGDNRRNSSDSRTFGPIDESSIVGRAFVLFWPPDRLRAL
jgi:signal peptidase I